jgi:ATP-dependent RNA helicase SUPV3L1/SUV3
LLHRNIKRVIFTTLQKAEDGRVIPLQASQIKQIAGRAGRFRVSGGASDSSASNDLGGFVTTLKIDDLNTLREGMSTPNPPLEQAMLWPPWRIFEEFSRQFPEGTPLATMISTLTDLSTTSRLYTTRQSNDQTKLAQAMEHIPNIDLETRYNLTFAPVATRSQAEMDAFVRMAEASSRAESVTIESPSLEVPLWILDTKNEVMTNSKLQAIEILHKLITCYCWLSYYYS